MAADELSSQMGERRFPPFAFGSRSDINRDMDAGWSSPVAREAHNLEVAGSNPVPAT